MSLAAAPPQLLVFPVEVESVSVGALLDTGATLSLMSWELSQQMPGELVPHNQTVIGLGGVETECMGMCSLDIWLGPVKFNHSFLIMPDAVMNHSVILGSDFFRQHGIRIDLAASKISAEEASRSWELYLRGQQVIPVFRELPIFVSRDVSDSCEDPTFIPVQVGDRVKLNASHTLFFDGHLAKPFSPFVVGDPGIIETQTGQFGVLVGRTHVGSRRTQVFKEGQLLGWVATLVDVESSEVSTFVGCAVAAGPEIVREALDVRHLEPQEQAEVLEKLQRFKRVFSQGDHDVGCAGVTQHRIELHDNTPIRQKPRRFPQPISDEIERQCQELVGLNILDYSKSPWSSPVVPVKKKDGSIRLCIDYRELNKVTKADRFPIPSMSELVFGLHGMRYFSTLDLVKGYYQVPLHPDSAECTAFSTSRNHYQFNRLSFGLRNAPAAFQREMQEVLKDFDNKQVLVYIDDILIMGRSFEEHLDLIVKVLCTLEQYAIKVKPSKCCWFRTEVSFLGHIVSQGGLRKSDEYMASVRNYPKPGNTEELRSFLGVVNFQRKFIPDCSSICQPLSRLTGRPAREKLLWTVEMEEAFAKLKEAICMDLELAYPDYGVSAEKLELATDASGVGSGACLSQMQSGVHRVIAYASMSFSRAQRNYSTIERELAAIRWAVHVFKGFLYGIPFILFTDHKPLVYMSNMAQTNGRLVRTMNELAGFDFEIRYRAGKDNTIADTFSRLAGEGSEEQRWPSAGELPEGLAVIQTVAGGGDSMVESLFIVLGHHRGQYNPELQMPESLVDLRRVLVEEILAHPTRYQMGTGRKVKAPVKLMQLPGQLPSDAFLSAFANVYRVNVWIHGEFQRPLMVGPSESLAGTDESVCVHVQCLAGIHYNPLAANRLYKPHLYDGNPCESQAEDLRDSVRELDTTLGEVCAIMEPRQQECVNCHSSTMSAKIMVQAEGQSLCGLVDTGAQFSLMSHTTRAKLQVVQVEESFVKHPVTIRALGTAVAVEEVVMATVSFAPGVQETITFAVVGDSCMPFCLILGAEVIRHLSLIVDYKKRMFSLQLGDEEGTVPFLILQQERPNQFEFCLAQQASGKPVASQGAPQLLTEEQVQLCQRTDKTLGKLYQMLTAGIPSRLWVSQEMGPYRYHASRLRIENGIIEYHCDGGAVPVVSFMVLVEVAIHFHWQMNHMGRNKLVDQLRNSLWNPGIHEVAADVATSCEVCQTCKVSALSIVPPMLKIATAGPFDLVAADLVLLPRTSVGHIGCLVVVDHFSKWLTCVPIRNKSAATVTSAFQYRVLPNLSGRPMRLLTDNGKEFVAEQFEEMLRRYDICHVYSSPYKPSSNGAVERTNRTVIEMLRCMAGQCEGQWDEWLGHAVISYNHTWHAALGMSPSKLLLSRAHGAPAKPIVSADTQELWREGHPNFEPFEVGKRVWLKVKTPGDLVTNKFMPRYKGPYMVTRVRSNGVTYEVAAADGRVMKAHHSQLKKYIECPDYINNSEVLRDVLRRYRGVQLDEVEDMDVATYVPVLDFSGFSVAGSTEESSSEEGGWNTAVRKTGTRQTKPSEGGSEDSSRGTQSEAGARIQGDDPRAGGSLERGLRSSSGSDTGTQESGAKGEDQERSDKEQWDWAGPRWSTPVGVGPSPVFSPSPVGYQRAGREKEEDASRAHFRHSCDLMQWEVCLDTMEECLEVQEVEIARLESLQAEGESMNGAAVLPGVNAESTGPADAGAQSGKKSVQQRGSQGGVSPRELHNLSEGEAGWDKESVGAEPGERPEFAGREQGGGPIAGGREGTVVEQLFTPPRQHLIVSSERSLGVGATDLEFSGFSTCRTQGDKGPCQGVRAPSVPHTFSSSKGVSGRRASLSPLKRYIAETRAVLEENRRRHRLRILAHARSRRSLQTGQSPFVGRIPEASQTGPVTRSQSRRERLMAVRSPRGGQGEVE